MSWLKEKTNKDEAYWMARVQNLIAKHTSPREDGHGDTSTDWIQDLVVEVISNLPPPEPPYDGNMRLAATLGYIFSLWYSQTHNAKTFDSHRPTFVRQLASNARTAWALDLIKNIIDISNGPTYFPGQPWQHPFDPEAKGGDFL